MKMNATGTILTYDAQWDSAANMYIVRDRRHRRCWYSHDGDWWTRMNGLPVQGTPFGEASITLHGGSRDGETVA
jgi:hypothetical protein